MVPHLITALAGPLNELEQRILDATPAIERWFRLEWMEHTPPIYAAIDIRNAGFKVAPTDTNLYPADWHNLAGDVLPLAVQAAQAAIEKICPEARNLLIVPKNGTPSDSDLANLARLRQIFGMVGLNVRYGSIDPALKKNAVYPLPEGDDTGGPITFEPAQRIGPSALRLGLKHFDPCTILLNNPLAAGAPGILEDLYEQYLLPPLQAGWTVRRMSRHYQCHDDICKRFGKLLGLDPWLIHPLFAACGEIAPGARPDAAVLREQVHALLAKIRRKYREYGIHDKPFAIIKARGHPLHLVTVRDVKELDALLERLPKCKGDADQAAFGPAAGDLLVQEGIAEAGQIDGAAAEPVVYTIDRYVVGGYHRLRQQQAGPHGHYVPLAFPGSVQPPRLARPGHDEIAASNRFYLYGVVGRLALVAASYELEATDPQVLALHEEAA